MFTKFARKCRWQPQKLCNALPLGVEGTRLVACLFSHFALDFGLWSQVLGCKDHQDQASRWHGWELECGNHFPTPVFLWFLYLVETFLAQPSAVHHWDHAILRWELNVPTLMEGQLHPLKASFEHSEFFVFFFIIHLQNHIFLTRMLQKSIRILTDLECKRCAKSQSTSSMFVLWRCDWYDFLWFVPLFRQYAPLEASGFSSWEDGFNSFLQFIDPRSSKGHDTHGNQNFQLETGMPQGKTLGFPEQKGGWSESFLPILNQALHCVCQVLPWNSL